jgi:hypothetical protein
LVELVGAADRSCYCDQVLTPVTFALDHAQPTARSGQHGLDNLRVCCAPCNERKGLLTAGEYAELLALVRNWHPRARSDLLARLRAGGKWRRWPTA